MDFGKILSLVRRNLQAGRDLSDAIDVKDSKQLLDHYSYFIDHRNTEGFLVDSEVEITDPCTPRPCLHLMASNHSEEFGVWGSFWDQFGGGLSFLDSALAGRMSSHLDANYVPTSPEPHDVRRFYVYESGRGPIVIRFLEGTK